MSQKLVEKQIALMNKVRKLANVNAVCCNKCDGIILHDRAEEHITCPWCNKKQSSGDCIDYIYEGMPEQTNSK